MHEELGICTTEVFPDGQGSIGGNARRLAVGRHVIETHDTGLIHLVAFPAGYLRAESEATVREVAEPLIETAREHELGLLVGVDTEPLKQLPSKRIRDGTLPSFLIAWAPGMEDPAVWRQRSRSRHHAVLGLDPTPRVLRVGRWEVAPLIGGEIFNDTFRDAVAAKRPEAVVLCAHYSAGSRHWAGQDSLRVAGLCSVRSVHASEPVTQCLIAPRGYRLANMSLMQAGLYAFSYFIDDEDKKSARSAGRGDSNMTPFF